MHHHNEKLNNININNLKAQINQYHLSNHTNFNHLTTQSNDPSNDLNAKIYFDFNNNNNNNKTFNLSPNLVNKNQNLLNFLIKSFKSSTSSLSNTEVNVCKQSPSLFTSLSAPRASIDCYQSSESPSLNEISNQQQIYFNNGSIGKASSLALTPENFSNESPNKNSINIDKIIDACGICKGFAIAAVNNNRRISYTNMNFIIPSFDYFTENGTTENCYQLNDETSINTVLNRNNLNAPSEVTLANSRLIMESKPDYCIKCFCFCCYDSLSDSKIFKVFKEKREKLKILVDGKLQRTILCAILVNTLSMGIEHHDQVC